MTTDMFWVLVLLLAANLVVALPVIAAFLDQPARSRRAPVRRDEPSRVPTRSP